MSDGSTSARIALNPIQWMASDDGWLDPSKAPAPEQRLSLIKQAGFDAVMAEVPADWAVEKYQAVLDEVGLTLAPGYFVCRSDGRDGKEADVVAGATAVARQHAQLGMTEIGLGLAMGKEARRVLHPAQAYDADESCVEAVTALIAQISDAMLAEGVRPSLHPHVGTWIETEEEGRAVLDALPSSRLGFLPDTGHLVWAGADVGAFVKDYAERIPFVHVKDCRLSVAAEGRAKDWGYQQTVLGGLWAEPGRGELDLTGILGNLPDTFDGWLMVEVDRPDIADPYESAQESARWMQSAFPSQEN
ncbi:sugar phosphate isomerase/epimerase [Actinoallomurus purpureus]|uniref:sugar phosphate isomerase/epimerase family protein n=1 Tax=Actinoallomurus purpureus TaxID=478114 RepID=UPI0020930C6E|nr:sugar phosphate isomerase/epimerase [Actinoallomurus purpureus]MCO6010799.1 sugar phosphate isomerase/epimerase [Actinoallomurus purpureus]